MLLSCSGDKNRESEPVNEITLNQAENKANPDSASTVSQLPGEGESGDQDSGTNDDPTGDNGGNNDNKATPPDDAAYRIIME